MGTFIAFVAIAGLLLPTGLFFNHSAAQTHIDVFLLDSALIAFSLFIISFLLFLGKFLHLICDRIRNLGDLNAK